MPRVSPPIRSLDHVRATHLKLGDFARFLNVETKQVWKWHRCGLIELVVPAGCKRGARIHIDEARRFYHSSRTPAA